jgi:hypothetical protein
MKLKKLNTADSLETLQPRVRKSTLDMLEKYREHYRATYGEEIKQSPLIDNMLRDYMESDRDFMKALASQAGKASQ